MVVRILHSYKSYRPEVIGGVAQVIDRILACSEGLESEVLVARVKGARTTRVEAGVRIEAVGSLGEAWSLPIAPTYPFALARAVRSVDAVIQHSPFPLGDLGLLAPRPKGVKVIVYWHADIVRSGLLADAAARLSRHTLANADRIVVSHESIIRSSAVLRRYASKCVVIPFSVDYSFWSDVGDDAAEISALRQRFPRLVVTVGRLVPYKGFDVLIDAMRSVDGQLIIIGTGPLEAALAEQVRTHRLEDRVLLRGHLSRDDVKTVLHAGRAFAFPSLTAAEAFGLAQLEAMAAGLPVVNTSLSTAVPHVARHGIEALTVQPGNVQELANALNQVLADEQLAVRLGQAGRIRVREAFSPQLFAERTRRLLSDVLQRPLS